MELQALGTFWEPKIVSWDNIISCVIVITHQNSGFLGDSAVMHSKQ